MGVAVVVVMMKMIVIMIVLGEELMEGSAVVMIWRWGEDDDGEMIR